MKVVIWTADRQWTFELERGWLQALVSMAADVDGRPWVSSQAWERNQGKPKPEPEKNLGGPGTYQGNVTLACPRCGGVTRRLLKYPQVDTLCEKCGKPILLRGLRPYDMRCRCGTNLRGNTNMDTVSVRCPRCGKEVVQQT